MARTIHTEWQQDMKFFAPASLCDIARSGPTHLPHQEPGAGIEQEHGRHDRMRRRVWRAVTWLVFANVLAFWLLTCITAFTQV